MQASLSLGVQQSETETRTLCNMWNITQKANQLQKLSSTSHYWAAMLRKVAEYTTLAIDLIWSFFKGEMRLTWTVTCCNWWIPYPSKYVNWIDAAMVRVVTTVGRELVMLVPDVHELFKSYASELSQYLNEDINVSKLATSAYTYIIISNLTANLQHHTLYNIQLHS